MEGMIQQTAGWLASCIAAQEKRETLQTDFYESHVRQNREKGRPERETWHESDYIHVDH